MGSIALMMVVVVPVDPVTVAAVTRPYVPASLLIVATLVFDEYQVTDDVTSSNVGLSLNVPRAVNCCCVP